MNSVAGQMVATTMNSNFSALKPNSSSGNNTNDFSKVFEQVNSKSLNRHQHRVNQPTKKVERPETIAIDLEVTEISVEAEQSAEVAAVTEKVQALSEEIKGEVTDVKAEMSTEELEIIYEEAIQVISDMFDIPVEALQSILQTHQMDLLDLSDNAKLIDIVQSVFGHEDMATMLLDPEATEALKAVHEQVQAVIDSLGDDLDTSTLREQLAALSGNTPEKAVDGQVSEPKGHSTTPIINKDGEGNMTQGPEMEVNDLRDAGKNTTKYNQNHSSGQEQNNQTFGEMVSQQVTNLKEVVGVGETNKPEFQQISTREVIDQIVTKAIVNLSNEKTSMQLQLNPGHLGKIAVSVTAEQGVVKGQFVAENSVVKEMLETNMIQLKTQLEEQGIKVDKIEVTIGNTNQFFEQGQQGNEQGKGSKQSKGNKAGRINRLMEMEVVDTIEQGVQSQPNLGEDVYTVEYSA